MNTPALPAGITFIQRNWLSSNSILLDDDEQLTLIDSGYGSQVAETLVLVEHHLSGRPLKRLWHTHLHSDHCGGTSQLSERYQPEVAVAASQLEAVQQWQPMALAYAECAQSCSRFEATTALVPEECHTIGRWRWQLLSATGHDADSLMLWAAEPGVLISADALWRNGFGVLFEVFEGRDGFAHQAHTLDLIASLAPRVVIPGHGAVFEQVDEALAVARQKLDYFATHPVQHARHATKVLLRYNLLEFGRMDINHCRERYRLSNTWQHMAELTGTDADGLLENTIHSLVSSGVIAREGQWLMEH